MKKFLRLVGGIFYEFLKVIESIPYTPSTDARLCNKAIEPQQGEDYIVVGQREILTSLSLRLKFLDEHPEIEKKLQEQGFTRNNLAMDDWSKGEGVYKALDIIREEQGI